ncbi:MAG: hypothetical protein R2877_08560 [Bdellovibrionota bacterium]
MQPSVNFQRIDHETSRSVRQVVAVGWGKAPAVRGTAMNPIDHPHGGGEGKARWSSSCIALGYAYKRLQNSYKQTQ